MIDKISGNISGKLFENCIKRIYNGRAEGVQVPARGDQEEKEV
jgi:hypothetical protein